jgi:hypothetical protein
MVTDLAAYGLALPARQYAYAAGTSLAGAMPTGLSLTSARDTGPHLRARTRTP